jgi:hypothetical protein
MGCRGSLSWTPQGGCCSGRPDQWEIDVNIRAVAVALALMLAFGGMKSVARLCR